MPGAGPYLGEEGHLLGSGSLGAHGMRGPAREGLSSGEVARRYIRPTATGVVIDRPSGVDGCLYRKTRKNGLLHCRKISAMPSKGQWKGKGSGMSA